MQTQKPLFLLVLTIFLLLAACQSSPPETIVETLIVTEVAEGENAETIVIEVEPYEEPAAYPTAGPSYNPTPLATSLGLQTDAHARVFDSAGQSINGLYAYGNDMHNIFGGEYPGAGAQIGSGMVFGTSPT